MFRRTCSLSAKAVLCGFCEDPGQTGNKCKPGRYILPGFYWSAFQGKAAVCGEASKRRLSGGKIYCFTSTCCTLECCNFQFTTADKKRLIVPTIMTLLAKEVNVQGNLRNKQHGSIHKKLVKVKAAANIAPPKYRRRNRFELLISI